MKASPIEQKRRARPDEPTAAPEAGGTHDAEAATVAPSAPADGKIGVNGTQVAASVLASVSAAVVASFFGVAGTIVGAAVVSVVATVSSAAYGLGIHRTKARLAQVPSLRAVRPPTALFRRSGAVPADAAGADAVGDDLGDGAVDDVPAAGDDGWRGWLSQRRWGLAAGVAIVFVISLVSVSLIEAVGPGPLSGEAGGARRTSIGALISGSDDGSGTPATTVPPTGSPSTTVDDGDGESGPATTTDRPATTASTVPPTSTTAPSTTTTTPTTPSTTADVPTTASPTP